VVTACAYARRSPVVCTGSTLVASGEAGAAVNEWIVPAVGGTRLRDLEVEDVDRVRSSTSAVFESD
jgi:hypothetical protein